MKITIGNILCGVLVVAFAAATASAQTKYSSSASCAKPDAKTIPAGDRPGHMFAIAQGTCTPKDQIGDATSKEGAFSEHDDITPSHMKGWGVYVETYDSGDKIFFTYQISMTTKDGALQSGTGTYQATGGTGKMKGIKVKGTCNYTPGADGATGVACNGEYTLAGAPMAAQ